VVAGVVAAGVVLAIGAVPAHGAVPPSVTLELSSFDFGDQLLGNTSSAQETELTLSCGSASFCSFNPVLSTTTVAFGAGDACPHPMEAQVNSPVSCDILVVFTPTAVGRLYGTLSTGYDSGSGITGPTASLTGVGVAPPPPARRRCKKPPLRSAWKAGKRCHRKRR